MKLTWRSLCVAYEYLDTCAFLASMEFEITQINAFQMLEGNSIVWGGHYQEPRGRDCRDRIEFGLDGTGTGCARDTEISSGHDQRPGGTRTSADSQQGRQRTYRG